MRLKNYFFASIVSIGLISATAWSIDDEAYNGTAFLNKTNKTIRHLSLSYLTESGGNIQHSVRVNIKPGGKAYIQAPSDLVEKVCQVDASCHYNNDGILTSYNFQSLRSNDPGSVQHFDGGEFIFTMKKDPLGQPMLTDVLKENPKFLRLNNALVHFNGEIFREKIGRSIRLLDRDDPSASNYKVLAVTGGITKIMLTDLYCYQTEDWAGKDECKLVITADGRRITKQKSLNNGQTWGLSVPLDFRHKVTIKLIDRDNPGFPLFDDDDLLGTVTIRPGQTEGEEVFDDDGANYSISWEPR